MMGHARPQSQHLVFSILLIAATFCLTSDTIVDAQDNVYLRSGSRSKISGKVTAVTPDSVTVKSGSRTRDFPAGNVRKIVFPSEPTPLGRARDRFDDGRFDDCISELQKIDPAPTNAGMIQEIAWLRAASSAEISLRGGNITAKNAGTMMATFSRSYPKSYRFFPATERLGQLLEAVGRIDLAEKEFRKLTASTWAPYQSAGLYRLGGALLKQQKFAEAKKSFEEIANVDANDNETLDYKQLAKCLAAKADALAGNADGAIAEIESLIKTESDTNERLFANLYNALGACYESKGEWQKAAMAYLHTELLFKKDAEAHAEALHRLSEVWTKLNDKVRADRARSTLKTRYRNSYWAR